MAPAIAAFLAMRSSDLTVAGLVGVKDEESIKSDFWIYGAADIGPSLSLNGMTLSLGGSRRFGPVSVFRSQRTLVY